MEKEIIKKLDLMESDKLTCYSEISGQKIYEIKNRSIYVAEFDIIHDTALRFPRVLFLLFMYKNVRISEVWTKEYVIGVKKEFLFDKLKETEYELKGFYYL